MSNISLRQLLGRIGGLEQCRRSTTKEDIRSTSGLRLREAKNTAQRKNPKGETPERIYST